MEFKHEVICKREENLQTSHQARLVSAPNNMFILGRNVPIFHNTRQRKPKKRNNFVQATSNRGPNELVPLVALRFACVMKDRRVAFVV